MNRIVENCLIVAVLLIIILIPVCLAIRKSRINKKKEIGNELIKAERQFKTCFHHIDQLDSFVIAMDQKKKVIFQMDLKDYKSELIDLKDVSNCIVEEKKQRNTIQLLQLVLRNSSQQALHHIILYKQYVDNEGRLKNLLKTASQWEVMINRAVSLTA
ncbi:MAG TPA: hypothetical protein VGM63_00645 [Mucilaginibacter sp.]